MTRSEFVAELDRLRKSFAGGQENPLCYSCVGCEGCMSCTFCKACSDCYRCTHCESCRSCTGCSHCYQSQRCHDCSHCTRSEVCRGSAFLVDCYSCSDCTYCYGCVGLTKKEFHILNVPTDRKTYFATIDQLEQALGRSVRPASATTSTALPKPRSNTRNL
jgi:hypothetical protein